MHACMYVCAFYVCMQQFALVQTQIFDLQVWLRRKQLCGLYVCMHAYMYVCMHVWMYAKSLPLSRLKYWTSKFDSDANSCVVCMYVCLHVCMHIPCVYVKSLPLSRLRYLTFKFNTDPNSCVVCMCVYACMYVCKE